MMNINGVFFMKKYQICTRCIMDTSDPYIEFDEQGVCNHCNTYKQSIKRGLLTGETGKRELAKIITKIKEDGKENEYDCLIGLSGGVDSTYVAYKLIEFGLRPLVLHLDNEWDSEVAQQNIEKTVSKLDLHIEHCRVDWTEFKDLQLAFLKASVPDLEIPTDHAIVSLFYKAAKEWGIKYFISGSNLATESHLPAAWSTGHRDWKYIENIHKMYGTVPLKSYPHHTVTDLVHYKLILRLNTINILNYMDYNKEKAMETLEKELGWQQYGGKHYESIYTRFVQGYILPTKFGYDKRRQHLSTLICSGQIDRNAALAEMEKNPYPSEELLETDIKVFKDKLGLTDQEYASLLSLPNQSFWDYPSYEKSWAFRAGRSLYLKLK